MPTTLDTSKLDRILAQVGGEVQAGTRETAEDVRNLAEQFAPRDTGKLAASGVVEETDTGHRVVFGRGLDDSRALAQEYGTVDQPAQPYLTPAAQNVDPAARVRARLQKLLS